MIAIIVCDLTASNHPVIVSTDPAQAIRKETNNKSFWQTEWTERYKGEYDREREQRQKVKVEEKVCTLRKKEVGRRKR